MKTKDKPKTPQPQPNPHPPTRRLYRPESPRLTFTPHAWARLHFFCHHGDTEIGGFGITAPDNLLRVVEFVPVRQYTTLVSVRFDDDAVADYFDRQVDLGRRPEQFARIWLHTHPGDSASPSHVDHVTFERVFGRCDWAVMFILARGGATFAQLRFNAGPGGALSLRTGVDYDLPFAGSDHEAWAAEFAACIEPERIASPMDAPPPDLRPDFPFFDDWEVDHVFG